MAPEKDRHSPENDLDTTLKEPVLLEVDLDNAKKVEQNNVVEETQRQVEEHKEAVIVESGLQNMQEEIKPDAMSVSTQDVITSHRSDLREEITNNLEIQKAEHEIKSSPESLQSRKDQLKDRLDFLESAVKKKKRGSEKAEKASLRTMDDEIDLYQKQLKSIQKNINALEKKKYVTTENTDAVIQQNHADLTRIENQTNILEQRILGAARSDGYVFTEKQSVTLAAGTQSSSRTNLNVVSKSPEELRQNVFLKTKEEAINAIQSMRNQIISVLDKKGKLNRLDKRLEEWQHKVEKATDLMTLHTIYDDGFIQVNKWLDGRTSKEYTDHMAALRQILHDNTRVFERVYNNAQQAIANGKESSFIENIASRTIQTGSTNTSSDGRSLGGDIKEGFAEGGLIGLLDKGLKNSNMSPGQQKFWKGAATIGMYAGGAYLAWKALTNSFGIFSEKPEDRKKGWKWLTGSLAVIAGPQLLSGGNIFDIISGGPFSKKITEWGEKGFDWASKTTVDAKQSIEAKTNYYAFPKISTLFSGMTYGQMANFVTEDSDGKIKVDQKKMKEYLDAHQDIDFRHERKKVLESMGADDENGLADLAFDAMGISYEDLTDPAKSKTEFNEIAAKRLQRLKELEEFLNENKYDRITKKGRLEVERYLKHGTPTLDDLEDHEKEYFVQNEASFDDANRTRDQKDHADLMPSLEEVSSRLNLSEKQKWDLIRAGNLFYQDWKVKDKNTRIEFVDMQNAVGFGSYGEAVQLDIKNTAIDGLYNDQGNPLQFDSYTEMIKAANFVNFLKHHFKGKAKREDPFDVTMIGRNISFNKNSRDTWAWKEYFNLHTEIIDAGRFGTLQNISPKLESNKKQFVQYLNTLKSSTGGSVWHESNLDKAADYVTEEKEENDEEDGSKIKKEKKSDIEEEKDIDTEETSEQEKKSSSMPFKEVFTNAGIELSADELIHVEKGLELIENHKGGDMFSNVSLENEQGNVVLGSHNKRRAIDVHEKKVAIRVGEDAGEGNYENLPFSCSSIESTLLLANMLNYFRSQYKGSMEHEKPFMVDEKEFAIYEKKADGKKGNIVADKAYLKSIDAGFSVKNLNDIVAGLHQYPDWKKSVSIQEKTTQPEGKKITVEQLQPQKERVINTWNNNLSSIDLNTFSIDNKNFNLLKTVENGVFIVECFGQKNVWLDTNKKTIVVGNEGYSQVPLNIGFSSIEDLLATGVLVGYLLKQYKGISTKEDPFNMTLVNDDIEFATGNIMDDNVLTATELEKISPIFKNSDKKEYFISRLNTIKAKKGGKEFSYWVGSQRKYDIRDK